MRKSAQQIAIAEQKVRHNRKIKDKQIKIAMTNYNRKLNRKQIAIKEEKMKHNGKTNETPTISQSKMMNKETRISENTVFRGKYF